MPGLHELEGQAGYGTSSGVAQARRGRPGSGRRGGTRSQARDEHLGVGVIDGIKEARGLERMLGPRRSTLGLERLDTVL